MQHDPHDVLEENQRRRRNLHVDYDPIRGVGSPIERFPFQVHPDWRPVYLPKTMQDHRAVTFSQQAGSLYTYADLIGKPWDEVLFEFRRDRCKEDFEYWCSSVAKIKDKEGRTIDLVPNRPQREYIRQLEQQRMAGRPVRMILLKHRQWGATTLSYAYIAWHQMELHRSRDAWIVAQDSDAAKDVMARYDRIRENYPFRDLGWRPYAGQRNSKIIPERDTKISTGTVKNPNAPSGRTPQYVHLTEIGKWPNNRVESAEDLVANVESMLVDEPGTVGIQESTLKGETGTFFKELCQRARKGDTSYNFWFASWTVDPQYRLEAGEHNLASYDPGDVEEFMGTWTEYDEFLWDHGCTLAQINWYQRQRSKPGYIVKPHKLKQEFPTTADEAMVVGENRVFPPAYVEAARQTCKEPEAVGDVYGASETGAKALEDIHFEEEPYGPLKIWRRPGDTYGGLLPNYVPDETTRIKNRYAAASDVGPGQSRTADYSVTAVLDRAPMLWGGHPEIVCEWHDHLDVDLYAWRAARLAKWYGMAYWMLEVNSLNKKRSVSERDPSYGMTVLQEIKPWYGNLYHRVVEDKTSGEKTRKAGWYMTGNNKGIIVSALTKHLRGARNALNGESADFAYIEREEKACQQMDSFLEIEGSMRAADGKKDDRVDVRCMLAHLNDKMGPPSPVTPRERSSGQGGATRI